ncbi:hypothetical protein BaRGS_00016345 [Batillaria attramentaria]|uniref:Uncharacterized protein n=1 Tax=Batillaria attramentaria TaxID=370345 RepID=A0ABD0KZ80_9CAEN
MYSVRLPGARELVGLWEREWCDTDSSTDWQLCCSLSQTPGAAIVRLWQGIIWPTRWPQLVRSDCLHVSSRLYNYTHIAVVVIVVFVSCSQVTDTRRQCTAVNERL